jgi:phytoene dehydrogenase-like protein
MLMDARAGDGEVNIVGAGPNGLAAAVTFARAGLRVRLFEREETVGGGARSAELTLPGFHHDVCSAVHPMALASGFFRRFRLTDRVRFVVPEVSYGHPLGGDRAGLAYRSLAETVEALGRDGRAYLQLMRPLVDRADDLAQLTGSALLRIPHHPVLEAEFGLRVAEQGSGLWNARFQDEVAPAMITGVAGHAVRTLPSLAAAGVALTLGAFAHARGWPVPVGGSEAIAQALADDFREHGGEIVTGVEVSDLDELPSARANLLDVSPRALAAIAGRRLPDRYLSALSAFRYGNGVAKVDFALSAPVPWSNTELHRTATVHLGGTREEIARAEREVALGRHSAKPYVLVAQPSLFDSSRAPEGKHTLWAYTHVPHGSDLDQTDAIVRQIERFAPGFRDTILASSSMSARQLSEHNPNYVGGDISGGLLSLSQLVARPVLSADPWRTPGRGIYLCSASTPPGPSVHGLAGWYAARSALKHEFGLGTPSLAP